MSAAIRAVARGDLGCEAVVRRAGELAVLGWVRSDVAGEIALHAEGDPAGVEGLTAFVRERTDGIEVAPVKTEGHEQFAIRGVSAGAFVVHEHDGRYRLALEVEGAMRSWAVPKEPSLDPAVKRFAVETEDEPKGEVWDQGAYEQGGRVPWPEALDRGHAVFVLHGERLRGGFALQRTRPPQWLLVKRRD